MMAAETSDLVVERADGIITLTFNRPAKANAVTPGIAAPVVSLTTPVIPLWA